MSELRDSPADSIRKLRRRAHLTQPQLARILGVSTLTISRWERGKTRPDRETMARVRRFDDIVGLVGPAMAPEALVDFMDSRHSMLRNYRPRDLLSNEFAFEALTNFIESANSGDMI
jgi:transcriptional regulator with XRE-family HTH domain